MKKSGKSGSASAPAEPAAALQRPPAEVLYADELERLRESDKLPRPPGWQLSPRAVRTFILGDASLDLVAADFELTHDIGDHRMYVSLAAKLHQKTDALHWRLLSTISSAMCSAARGTPL